MKSMCHSCGLYYEGLYCPNHGTAVPSKANPEPMGTIADAIRESMREIGVENRKTVACALQSAIQLIRVAEDVKEAEKLVQKLLETYQ